MRKKVFKLLSCMCAFLVFSNFTSNDTSTTNDEPVERSTTINFGLSSSGRVQLNSSCSSFTDSLGNVWKTSCGAVSAAYSSKMEYKNNSTSTWTEVTMEHTFPSTVLLKSCSVSAENQYSHAHNYIYDTSSGETQLARKDKSAGAYGDCTVSYSATRPMTKLKIRLTLLKNSSYKTQTYGYLYLYNMSYSYIENPAQHTVTFDTNGHGTAPASKIGYEGCTISAPTAPTADGYKFLGWYKEQECVNVWNFSSDVVPSDDFTLYAKWSCFPYGKGLGGWYFKNNIRTQLVMFGFTYGDCDTLSDSDSYGIYLYSDSGTTLVTTFSGSGRVSELKSKQGRFYCTYDCPTQGATLYAKAFVTVSGSTVYSSIVSATGNFNNYYSN